MIDFFLILAALVVTSLTIGPVSHFTLAGYGAPNLAVIASWALVWFVDAKIAYRWAIILGLMLDFVSFLPFGLWTTSLVLITYAANLLKNRFFEPSSLIQSLVVLSLQLLIWEIMIAVLSRQILTAATAFSFLYSLVFAVLAYYVAAVRFKLLQHWLGRKL
jgi:rod shape-determining protein MreD